MRLTRPRGAPTILALLAAAGLAACGGAGEDTRAAANRAETSQRAQRILTAEDIRRAPDEPSRAVLAWWRAAQFRAPSEVRRLMTPEARRRTPRLEETVYRDFGPWLQFAQPSVISTERQGASAIVYLRFDLRQVAAPKVIQSTRQYLAVAVRRTDGAWRIDDPTFLLQAGDGLRRDRLLAEARERRG